MHSRLLRNLTVSAIGYGCMGLSHGYGPAPDTATAQHLIQQAYALGCTFFDTAEGYGNGANEALVGQAVRPFRHDIVLATKFIFPLDRPVPDVTTLPRTIEAHVDASLRRLQTDYVDLYYYHRIHPALPIEAVAAAVAPLLKKGKIRAWGLSQCDAQTLRKAHAVTPVTAVQSEYSLMERRFERDILPACRELRIGFVPFSPLGAGFLSGKYHAGGHYRGDDVRRVITRFTDENIHKNQPLLDTITAFANDNHMTPAQLSLAWMLHKYPFLVPIPSARTTARIAENLGAASCTLADAEFAAFEKAVATIPIYGNRTDEDIMKLKTLT